TARAFDVARGGVLGLEHAAALTFEALGGADASPARFFELLSRAPARLAQLRRADEPVGLSGHGGEVAVDEAANLVVFDPAARWSVDATRLQSRARNTPYAGRDLTGRVRATIVRGRVVVAHGELA
ncbi:MAG: hypothetical protein ACHQFZ_03155, partial [Acidimicrobiales bacterium]